MKGTAENISTVLKNFLPRFSIQMLISLLRTRLIKWCQSLGILKNDFWKQETVRQATLDN